MQHQPERVKFNVFFLIVFSLVLVSCNSPLSEKSSSGSDEPPVINSTLNLPACEQANYQQCVSDVTAAIDKDGNNPYLYYQRGLARKNLDQVVAAVDDFTYAIDLDSIYLDAYTQRATLYNATQRYSEAQKDCETTLALDSTHALAHLVCGETASQLGNQETAIKAYTQAIVYDLTLADAYLQRGIAYLDIGSAIAAQQDLTVAIALNPDLAEAYTWNGNVELQLGHEAAALDEFEQAVVVDPEYDFGYRTIGAYHLAHQNYGLAQQAYDRALEINPRYAIAYRERSWAYTFQNMPQEALKDRENAVRYDLNRTGVASGNTDFEITRIWQIDNLNGKQPSLGAFLVMDVILYNYAADKLCVTKKAFNAFTEGEFRTASANAMEQIRDIYYPGQDFPGNKEFCVESYGTRSTFLAYDAPLNVTNLEMTIKPRGELSHFNLLMGVKPNNDYRFIMQTLNGQELITIKDVRFVDMVERTLEVERVTAQHCETTGIVSGSRMLSRSTSQTTNFQETYLFDLNLTLNPAFQQVILLPIHAQYERTTGHSKAETLTYEQEQVFEATPGHVAEFEIVWLLMSREGEVTFEVNGQPFTLPFIFDETIQPVITPFRQITCEEAQRQNQQNDQDSQSDAPGTNM